MRGSFDLLTAVPGVMALAPTALPRYVAQLQALQSGREAGAAAKTTKATSSAPRTTAVVEVAGVILAKPNWISDVMGWATSAGIKSAVDAAAADDSIDEIVLLIDSPGGDVTGLPEAANAVFAARDAKPVHAYLDGLAASAAYWLASQADDITMLGSGEVGSIGVIATHVDVSRANDADGITVTHLTSSKYKAEMSSDAPLSREAAEFEMSRLMEYHSQFTSAVARGRNVPAAKVESSFGQGRIFGSAQALKVGMADNTASSATQALLARGRAAKSPSAMLRAIRDEERSILIAAYKDPVLAAQLRASGWAPT